MDKADVVRKIASTLAGVYSWVSSDLEKDFVTYIEEVCPSLSPEVTAGIFRSFDKIDPIVRDNASFNVIDFVNDEISAL